MVSVPTLRADASHALRTSTHPHASQPPFVYTHCHLRERSLGTNDVLARLPVSRRIAADVERGRATHR